MNTDHVKHYSPRPKAIPKQIHLDQLIQIQTLFAVAILRYLRIHKMREKEGLLCQFNIVKSYGKLPKAMPKHGKPVV